MKVSQPSEDRICRSLAGSFQAESEDSKEITCATSVPNVYSCSLTGNQKRPSLVTPILILQILWLGAYRFVQALLSSMVDETALKKYRSVQSVKLLPTLASQLGGFTQCRCRLVLVGLTF